MDEVRMTIEGMTCGHCIRAVERALQEIDGVEVEKIEIGAAHVSYDPARVRSEQLTEAVEEEGYTVRGIQRAG